MSANITIKVSGVSKLVKDFDGLRFDLKNNMSVPLDESAMKYLKVVHMNFNSEGSTFGEKWPPLSPATVSEKRRLNKAGKSIAITKPLIRTGKLKTGFGRKIDRAGNTSYIYNTQSYATIHQEGATVSFHNRNVTVPKRVLVAVDEERVRMVAAVFTDWFNKIVKKNS